jgi:sugar transferase (PEP-CTERM/EpsH1 system associated)
MHAVFSLETGGLENGVVNLCNRLDPERFQASICVFQGGGELESRVDPERVELLTLRRLRNNDPSLPFRLAWQLWRHRIDVLHTHSWGTLMEGVIAAKLARTPVVVHGEHGIMETRPRNVRLQRLMWSRTQQVTAVARPLADRMADLVGYSRKRIQVIPNGVDTVRFSPRPQERNEARRHFGLPQSNLVVGMVARMVPVKNHRGVLDAVADLVEAGMPITLALAGDGPLLGELQRIAGELGLQGRVRFLGDVANVDRFLESLDLFVLNSLSEGMSNTVLEAMACGLPVVATTVGANTDLVVEGQTGLLIPPNDCAALRHAIAVLAADSPLRESMGNQGRARVERLHGMEKMVRDYSQLYDELHEKSFPTSRAVTDTTRCRPSQDLGAGHTA